MGNLKFGWLYLILFLLILPACTINPPSIRKAPIEPMPWDMTANALRNPVGFTNVQEVGSYLVQLVEPITAENVDDLQIVGVIENRAADQTIYFEFEWTGDGENLILANEDGISVIDIETQSLINTISPTLPGSKIKDIDVASQKNIIAISYKGGEIILYDLDSQTITQEIPVVGNAGSSTLVALTSDGSTVAFSTSSATSGTYILEIDEEADSSTNTLLTANSARYIAFSPDDSMFVMYGQYKDRGNLYSTTPWAFRFFVQGDGPPVGEFIFSPDNQYWAGNHQDNVILWWIPNQSSLTPIDVKTRGMGKLAFTSDSNMLATLTNREIIFWPVDRATQSPDPISTYTFEEDQYPIQISISPDGRLIAAATKQDILLLGVIPKIEE